MKDQSPATYTLVWLIPLPSTGLTASATLDNDMATIKWNTQSEQNTSHFIIERSIDNRTFTATAGRVNAAGNSDSRRDYEMRDNISGLAHNGIIYYRVKLVDVDGKYAYSNTVIVRVLAELRTTAWPNPFQSVINISVNADKATTINIKLSDVNGRMIRTVSQAVSKGISQIALHDVERLPAGVYLVEMKDERSTIKTVYKLIKR
jgi:hypothetical protein